MRPVACLFALAMPLAAQDAWSARVAAHRARQRPGAEYCLLVRPEGEAWRGVWASDEGAGGLLISGDLQVSTFGKGEAEDLARRFGWGPQARWVLLNPRGEIAASGERGPEAEALLNAFRGLGWVPRGERRARFLEDHPDQGDARLEALEEAVGSATSMDLRRERTDGQVHAPSAEDLQRDQRLWHQALAAMMDLRRVEGWLDQPRLQDGLGLLPFGTLRGAEGLALEVPLRSVRGDLEGALLRRPSAERLWRAWEWSAALDAQARPEALLEALVPLPGEPRLPVAAALSLRRVALIREDWAALERLATQALQPVWPTGAGWRQGELRMRQGQLAAWVPALATAWAGQDRFPQVVELLAQAQPLAGAGWRRLIRDVRVGVSMARLNRETPLPEAVRAFYGAGDLPDPPVTPDPPGLRAILLGVPGWKGAWDRLRRHEAFDSFHPGELQWTELTVGQQAALRQAREWGEGPRWVLLRGEAVVATGTTQPEAAPLADLARAERPPDLETLRAFVAAHPDHEEGRERLQDVLVRRMPHPRLEVQLVAQAVRTLKPFLPPEGPKAGEPGAWKPMAELWSAPARQVLPRLEARLARWPESLDHWQAWLDWASVHPAPPDPTALFERLPVWKTRARGGPAPLPSDIVLLVARRLLAAGRWDALARWGRVMWDGGIGAQAQAAFGTEPRVERAQGSELVFLLRGLVPLYLEALNRTGHPEAARAFSRQWAFLPGVGDRSAPVPRR